jgi:hypothetical protein
MVTSLMAALATLCFVQLLGDDLRVSERGEACIGFLITRLRFLRISECGEMASLAPIESLTELEVLYAWGSTRIVDGDLSPLARLPRLKEVRMRNRRGYKPPVDELPAAVS